jgi:hypothetical protein
MPLWYFGNKEVQTDCLFFQIAPSTANRNSNFSSTLAQHHFQTDWKFQSEFPNIFVGRLQRLRGDSENINLRMFSDGD